MRRHLIMYLVGLKETTETAVRISGLRAEIWTRYLPNTDQEWSTVTFCIWCSVAFVLIFPCCKTLLAYVSFPLALWRFFVLSFEYWKCSLHDKVLLLLHIFVFLCTPVVLLVVLPSFSFCFRINETVSVIILVFPVLCKPGGMPFSYSVLHDFHVESTGSDIWIISSDGIFFVVISISQVWSRTLKVHYVEGEWLRYCLILCASPPCSLIAMSYIGYVIKIIQKITSSCIIETWNYFMVDLKVIMFYHTEWFP
jgi:hypothetical protein